MIGNSAVPRWLWAMLAFFVLGRALVGLGAVHFSIGLRQLAAAGVQLDQVERLDAALGEQYRLAQTSFAIARDPSRSEAQRRQAQAKMNGSMAAADNLARQLRAQQLDSRLTAALARVEADRAASFAAWRAALPSSAPNHQASVLSHSPLSDPARFYADQTASLQLLAQAQSRSADAITRWADHAHLADWVTSVLALMVLSAFGWLVIRHAHQRQAAFAALRISEERHRSLFENASDPVFIADREGKLLAANPQWNRLTGFDPGEAGVNLLDLALPGSRAALGDLLRDRSPQQRVIEMRSRTGDVLALELSCGALDDEVEVIARDATQRTAADRLKAELIGHVSHELRTPLTSLRGSLGLLTSGMMGDIPSQAQSVLQMADRNADRLVRLVNDILEYERLQSGAVQIRRETCDARALVLQALDGMAGLASSAGVELRAEAQSFLLPADPDRLQQVLGNLISNAIKFAPANSPVRVQAQLQDGEAEFRVIDQGRGIPAAMLDSIFERFRQVQNGDAIEKGGTGLGLPICRGIVHQHGGRIWAESEPGAGSTFVVRLPLVTRAEEPSPASLRAEAALSL